ncbi:RsmB/NOP family class I SAM-dependent RNA methyltransferase [Leptolyngbya iicbica]|uniref:RsmB/NOP family class I SAM-dependent RNA methyltransferase n=2 Tax=Cyanophyceae TaxID=3028117 RepID=A0A4Q7EEW9_9CYAN|nr:RsmB/NOP family class I SAM-dependent RNA methyltransferase [Leptolyngbya sp. LK]RZM81785.1 RsmB/NOP family class I SAM-dependent RNA methyltransferase [Leptolyngbya sp. LK]
MSEPSKSLPKLAARLFAETGDRAAFIQSLTAPQPLAPSILWTRPKPPDLDWPTLPSLSWQPSQVDRLAGDHRPGQHPLHEQGYYYCLDFSSVFAVSLLQAIAEPIEVAIDLCAAPGGKSLCTWVMQTPQRLLCNEVIRKRVKILIANLKRCGAMEAIVLNQDPAVLAEHLPYSAQLVLVDAPCSGQSLLAKGQEVPGCFHKVTINRNANRQKRILANAAQLVQANGYLLYSTCTYAPQENEQVCQWFLKRFPDFQAVPVKAMAAFQSHLTPSPCYRLWPQSGLGAGAFAMLLQRQQGSRQPLNEDFLAQSQFKLHPKNL